MVLLLIYLHKHGQNPNRSVPNMCARVCTRLSVKFKALMNIKLKGFQSAYFNLKQLQFCYDLTYFPHMLKI